MSLSLLKSVILLLFHLVLVRALLNSQNTEQHNYNRKDEILSYLFQNRTNIFNTDERHALRKLPIVKTPYDAADPVQCVVCPVGKMNYCSIVGGKLIQEVYYPKNPAFLESCNVLESLGKRMYDEIFGVGKTFRDTPQCRDIVMQYLCLFFGSNNGMYKNYCIYQEVYIGTKSEFLLAPRPPCKSFCVQVAMVCANEMDFIQTCDEIECPQPDGQCTSDPVINGSPLDAKLGCDVPYYKDPYAPKSAAAVGLTGVKGSGWWMSAVSVVLASGVMMYFSA